MPYAFTFFISVLSLSSEILRRRRAQQISPGSSLLNRLRLPPQSPKGCSSNPPASPERPSASVEALRCRAGSRAGAALLEARRAGPRVQRSSNGVLLKAARPLPPQSSLLITFLRSVLSLRYSPPSRLLLSTLRHRHLCLVPSI